MTATPSDAGLPAVNGLRAFRMAPSAEAHRAAPHVQHSVVDVRVPPETSSDSALAAVVSALRGVEALRFTSTQ